MDEAAVRQLVREALGRHLDRSGQAGMSGQSGSPGLVSAHVSRWSGINRGQSPVVDARQDWKTHVSHGRLPMQPPADGSCIVEPAVRCTHCGFCESYGH